MTQWYYEQGGVRHGPVEEGELRQLYAAQAITGANLVWNAALGDQWIRFDACALAQAPAAAPPPPPVPAPAPPPVAPPAPAIIASPRDAFLTSDLTRLLVGPRSPKYLSKWGAMFAKSGPTVEQAVKARSWNWAAFLVPTIWPFYRKLWTLGAALMAVQIVILFLPAGFDALTRSAGIGIGIGCALAANTMYLKHVHRRWLALSALPDQEEARRRATTEGGVSGVAAAGATVVLFAAIGVVLAPVLRGLTMGELDCARPNITETVERIAHEQLAAVAAANGIDEPGTSISLQNARTTTSDQAHSECAGTLVYLVRMKASLLSDPAKGTDSASSLSAKLSGEVTYRTETRPDGKIYVLVKGLRS